MAEKHTLPYEEAAHRVTVTGWACKTCRRWWADDEHMARYCCARDEPCPCGGRKSKSYTVCEACRRKEDDGRWAKLYEKAVEWDGETVLATWDNDLFFHCPEDIEEYLEDDPERRVEDLRLQLCTAEGPPEFEMADFLSDHLHEDDDTDFAEIDRLVNAWIKANVPDAWYGDGPAVKVESLPGRREEGD